MNLVLFVAKRERKLPRRNPNLIISNENAWYMSSDDHRKSHPLVCVCVCVCVWANSSRYLFRRKVSHNFVDCIRAFSKHERYERDAKLGSGHRFKRHRRGYMCYAEDDFVADDLDEEFGQSKRTDVSTPDYIIRPENKMQFSVRNGHTCAPSSYTVCSGAEPLVWHRWCANCETQLFHFPFFFCVETFSFAQRRKKCISAKICSRRTCCTRMLI